MPSVTIEELKQSITTYDGKIMGADVGDFFDAQYNKDGSRKASPGKFKFTYQNISLLKPDGTKVNPAWAGKGIEFDCLLTASDPISFANDEDENSAPKHVLVTFRRFTLEEIKDIFPPKTKPTPEAQERENKKKEMMTKMLFDKLNDFCDVMDAINDNYKQHVERIIKMSVDGDAKLKYKPQKNEKLPKNAIGVFEFKKTTMKNRETDEEEKLDTPRYTLKIPVDKESRRLMKVVNKGRGNNRVKVPRDVLFTSASAPAHQKDVPLTVNGANVNVDNIAQAMPKYSIISGSHNFKSIIFSTAGASLGQEADKIYVIPYKGVPRNRAAVSEKAVERINLCIDSSDEEEEQEPIEDVEGAVDVDGFEEPEDDPLTDDEGPPIAVASKPVVNA